MNDKGNGLKRRILSPSIVLISGFAATILVGTGLLMLPAMSHKGGIGFVDALFTATSAVCVTGLIVVDTGSYFTAAGQWVILVLIQVGALGIFTFSSFFLLVLRGDTTLRGRMLIQETMTHFPYRNLIRLLRNILLFTFGTEVLGAVLLWLVFRIRYSDARAIYFAVFHSVSAFCNAGFSLWSTSFMDYSANAAVCLTVMALIVLGGLGFTVVTELGSRVRRRGSEFRRISLNTRIVLTTTGVLIAGGALLFWLLEQDDAAFTARPFFEQVLVSFFQSVTARTAGFNTVNIADLTSATLFILVCLMFIGASPGSVGGGVKTTTFSIYVVMITSYLRGKQHAELFGRTIPTRITTKAMATIATSFALVIVSTILLGAFEGHRTGKEADPYFLGWLFEVVSAFGTVGLSTGVTPGLKTASKLVIIGTMFAGRVGPLGLALSLMGREAEQRYKYPEENVMIG